VSRLLSLTAAVTAIFAVLVLSPAATPSPVGSDDVTYQACGRVFPDPHAYWPSTLQAPARSSFAKGNAACSAIDFLQYDEMTSGMRELDKLFPRFLQFYTLSKDFGNGANCATSVSSQDYCSAGLPRQGVPGQRVKFDLYMVRVTDESVPDTNKKFFVFPLSIHAIERAGAEGGVRAAEDLATWAYCEAVKTGSLTANGLTNCTQEGTIPHPLLEATPGESVTAGDALKRSVIYFIFPNADGWKRGDRDNGVRFYQRYNGNGVDMNRDWPSVGFTYRPYTPWSEPETRAFGKVLKGIHGGRFDGGIDLHGQLVDRAFSFTLLGQGQKDYSKNQRILQTVKGAWEDAEKRLAWSPLIKPNTAPADDQRVYGVQWGTVWDTINYTTTGALGDWIDSPLGLNADGIDNEMSLSHISNCGIGSCYAPDVEQLHIDGNKSLVYSMVNFSLKPEDTQFRVPGKVGYVYDPAVVANTGQLKTPPPTAGLPPQPAIRNVLLTPTNGFTYQFDVKGPDEGVYNGGLEGMATPENVAGVGPESLTSLVLERYRPDEPPVDGEGCGTEAGGNWEEVNRYYNQSSIYLQSGQAVHANQPLPGTYRICVTGGLAAAAANGGVVKLDITFSTEEAWADPGQLPYSVTNMKFFADLAKNMQPGQLVPVSVDDVLAGKVNLDRYSSLVVADNPFPGYSEQPASGPAQPATVYEPPTEAAATVPCAYSPGTQDELPPTCVANYEFDVSAAYNNQSLTVRMTASDLETVGDWDLYLERQSRISGEWFPVSKSATGTPNEAIHILTPPVGHYRARIVNWAGTQPPQKLEISFSNVYEGPPIAPSTRTDAQRAVWAEKLKGYAQRGGNLVLTDGAIRDLAYMGLLQRNLINNFSVYAGFIGFTRDGSADTYSDPLAADVNQPGAAEGANHRHQTYEPVPLGFAIQDPDGADFDSSPAWGIDQIAWENAGGRTVGITTADQVSLGELKLGDGVVRVIGALLPMPTERYYHPYGLADYATTYSGYQVLKNALQWQRTYPDLTLAPADITFTSVKDDTTIRAVVHNAGDAAAAAVPIRFTVDGAQVGTTQTIASIAPGGTGVASVVWNTKKAKGQHVVAVTADPADVIAESDETNNTASRTVEVKANQVQNGSFEQSSTGSAPDSWSSSGSTSYDSGGSDGSRSVSTGPGGSWTSAPVAVTAGNTYDVSVDVAGGGGKLLVEQLSPTGLVLGTVSQALGATAIFQTVTGSVTAGSGVTQVRVRLVGSLAATTRFDDVWLTNRL
jgi:CARDB/Zinc carboxypeptidase